MSVPIRLLAGEVVLTGELTDGPIAVELAAQLPLAGTLRRFGDSYYIETPVNLCVGPGASDEVSRGSLAYWPAAQALMVFFGPTPESAPGSDSPVAPGEVEIVGHLADTSLLCAAPEPGQLRVERA